MEDSNIHHHHRDRFSHEDLSELLDTFRSIDIDDSGFISKEEFRKVVKKSAPKLSDGAIDFTFNIADRDHSSQIDFNEFLDLFWMLSHPKNDVDSVRLVFSAFDQDNSGFLSKSELSGAFKQLGVTFTDKQLENCYNKVDRDHDGKISFKEFFSLYRIVGDITED